MGKTDGTAVGIPLGIEVGEEEGSGVGLLLGTAVGNAVGKRVGDEEGLAVGDAVVLLHTCTMSPWAPGRHLPPSMLNCSSY